MPAREAQHFGGHHQTHHVIGQILANADAVRQHQIALQFSQPFRRNARLRQFAEAGINAVNHFAGFDDARDRLLRSLNICPRVLRQLEADVTLINLAQRR